jgi:hypothetical protein
MGIVQKRIRDYLPNVEIHVAIEGLQRPQRQPYFELIIGRELQQVHRDVGGDQSQDCGNFHISRIF